MAIQMQQFLTPAPSRRDRARIRLLEAAVEIFGEKGPEGARVREIARAAGQNVAAIAYYFGSKEKLYQAVIGGMVLEMRHRLADVFGEVARLRREADPAPADARRLLKAFLRGVFLRLVSRSEAISIGQLIVREQLRPTKAFAVLHEEGFRPLHEALSFLVGTALGRDPASREIMVRTHMLMGQVYFFAMTRQGILRRLGWKDFAGSKAVLVADLLDEHIEELLSALAKKPRQPLSKL